MTLHRQGQTTVTHDWNSSQEPMEIDEAIENDNRILNDLKDQVDLPRVTSQLSRHLEKMAAA